MVITGAGDMINFVSYFVGKVEFSWNLFLWRLNNGFIHVVRKKKQKTCKFLLCC